MREFQSKICVVGTCGVGGAREVHVGGFQKYLWFNIIIIILFWIGLDATTDTSTTLLQEFKKKMLSYE